MIATKIKKIENRLEELCQATCLWMDGLTLTMKADGEKIIVHPAVYATDGHSDKLVETWRIAYDAENGYAPYPGQNARPECWTDVVYVKCGTANGTSIFDGTPEDFVRKMASYDVIAEFYEEGLREDCYDYFLTKGHLENAKHVVESTLLRGTVVRYVHRSQMSIAGVETVLTQTGKALVLNVEPTDVSLLDLSTGVVLSYDPTKNDMDTKIS